MKPRRIICVGNRYCESDAAGWRVLQRLRELPLPPGVEVIDGGLGGLNLLGLVEPSDRVVFVDQVRGAAQPGQVVVLDGTEACESPVLRYGHGGGLGYLLNVLAAEPEERRTVTVVGLEGCPDADGIDRAAQCALAAVADVPDGARTGGGHAEA